MDHTGRPSWDQQAWAAVLCCWPAALHGGSALRAYDGPHLGERSGERVIVHVAVDRRRSRPAPPAGVVVHQVARLDETVLWNLGPPRRRYAEAVLDAAAEAQTELDRVAVLARAGTTRRTTAAQLLATLALRTRHPHRRWTQGVLQDVANGTCSVLEHRYLTGVERAHGLPRAQRQKRERGIAGVVYRDGDLERDLDVAAAGRATVRLGLGPGAAEAVPDGLQGGGVPAAARHRGVRPSPRSHVPGRAAAARSHGRRTTAADRCHQVAVIRCCRVRADGSAALRGRRGCSTR